MYPEQEYFAHLTPIFDKMLRMRGWGCDLIDAFEVAEGVPRVCAGRDATRGRNLRLQRGASRMCGVGWIRAIAFEATPCWKTGGKLGQIDDIRWLRG